VAVDISTAPQSVAVTVVRPSDEGVAVAKGVELVEYREPQGAEPTGRPVSHLEDWRGRPPRDMGYDDDRLFRDVYDDQDDDFDEYGRRVGPSTLGKLTVLVMMDDQVVDVMRRPVQGTGYECAALELGRGKPAEPVRVTPPPQPEPPRHERELAWLARLVGGHEALAALDTDQLPDEPLDLSGVRGELRERVQVISERADDVAERLFGDEVRTACRRLLVRAVGAEPGLLREVSRDEIVPAAVVWAVAKGNDLVGSGRQMPASAIHALCGLKSAPTERGKAFAHAVAGPTGTGFDQWRHHSAADVLELGAADLLTWTFRRHLVVLRDLAEAERLRAAG